MPTPGTQTLSPTAGPFPASLFPRLLFPAATFAGTLPGGPQRQRPIPRPKALPRITPLIAGQPLLGLPDALSAFLFTGTATQAAAWLEVPGPVNWFGGRGIAVAGSLAGQDATTVQAALAALLAVAYGPTDLLVPTGLTVGDSDRWTSCVLDPTNFAAGAPYASPRWGTWLIDYLAIWHCLGTLQTAGSGWHPSQTGLRQPIPNGGPWRLLNDSRGNPILP
jgi:hypothetical protein